MCYLRLRTRRPCIFHRGSRRLEQDNSNGSSNHLKNPIGFANGQESLGKSFWSHDTHISTTFIVYLSIHSVSTGPIYKPSSCRDATTISHNETAGYLLRTKGVNTDEGGIMVGRACIDTPELVTDSDMITEIDCCKAAGCNCP